MNKNISIVLFTTGLLAVTIWWIRFGNNSEQPPAVSNAPLPTPAIQLFETTLDTEEGVEPEKPQPVSAAKTIVHVPPNKSNNHTSDTIDDLTAVNAENLIEFTSKNLDAALAGDIEAGYRVNQAKHRCDFAAKDQKGIELLVEQKTRKAQRMLGNGYTLNSTGFNSPSNAFPTESENRVHQTRWYEACLWQNDLFNEKLRQRLDQLAQQGHVVARYLYAIWPLDYLSNPDAFLIQQAWEEKARDYSYLNLEQGEVAGLLAYSHSYSGVNLFTRNDPILGMALLKAAYDCGFTGGIPPDVADRIFYLEHLPKSQRPTILAIAEKLVLYCH